MGSQRVGHDWATFTFISPNDWKPCRFSWVPPLASCCQAPWSCWNSLELKLSIFCPAGTLLGNPLSANCIILGCSSNTQALCYSFFPRFSNITLAKSIWGQHRIYWGKCLNSNYTGNNIVGVRGVFVLEASPHSLLNWGFLLLSTKLLKVLLCLLYKCGSQFESEFQTIVTHQRLFSVEVAFCHKWISCICC